MSEHQPIDLESYKKLEMDTRPLTGDERDRVTYHLMYGADHMASGYDVFYGYDEEKYPDLWEAYVNDIHAHQAAVIRGEISAEDLYSGYID